MQSGMDQSGATRTSCIVGEAYAVVVKEAEEDHRVEETRRRKVWEPSPPVAEVVLPLAWQNATKKMGKVLGVGFATNLWENYTLSQILVHEE